MTLDLWRLSTPQLASSLPHKHLALLSSSLALSFSSPEASLPSASHSSCVIWAVLLLIAQIGGERPLTQFMAKLIKAIN